MKRMASLCVAIAWGALGCSGGEVVELSPSSLFLGRTTRVTVVGHETSFSPEDALDFGPGVTVLSARTNSETSMLVDVRVEARAPLGAHDVSVGDAMPLIGGLTIASPIALELSRELQSGAVYPFSVTLQDSAHPFSEQTLQSSDGAYHPDVLIRGSEGLTFAVENVTGTQIDGLVAVDASASAGPVDMEVVSATNLGVFEYPMPEASVVVPGPTGQWIVDTVLTSVPSAYGSRLSWVRPGASLALVEVDASSTVGEPELVLLGADGKFPEDLRFRSRVREVVDSDVVRGVVMFDRTGMAGYPVELTARTRALTSFTEAEPNDEPGQAKVVGAPGVLISGGNLSGLHDVDVYAVDMAWGNLGRRLRIETRSDGRTDTRIAVIRDDEQSVFGFPSDDIDMLDELVTAPILEAGRYFVEVSAGSSFDGAHSSYEVLVVLE